MPLVDGFLFGLGTIIFFGAVFFTQLNVTLQYGLKAGSWLTVGILLADILCMLIVALGIFSFVDKAPGRFWLGLTGGLILLIVGLWYLVKPIKVSDQAASTNQQNSKLLIQGFMINFINPFTFIYWVGALGYSKMNYPENTNTIVFIISVILGIILIYFGKVFLARQIRRILQPKALGIISKVCGAVLIVMGLRLIYSII